MNYNCAPNSFSVSESQPALPRVSEAVEGTLLGIATRPASKAPMNEICSARITVARGVEHDARGNPGPRQVTVLTSGGWDAACDELGADRLPWTARRANLLIDGVELANKVGYELRVGDAILVITGETRPCGRMDKAHPGLKHSLQPDWRGGVCCRVIRSGDVAIGCNVTLARNVLRQLVWVVYLRGRRTYKAGRSTAGRVARQLGLKRQSFHG